MCVCCVYFQLIVKSAQTGNLLCQLIYGNLQFSDTHLQLINQQEFTHTHTHTIFRHKMFTLNANKWYGSMFMCNVFTNNVINFSTIPSISCLKVGKISSDNQIKVMFFLLSSYTFSVADLMLIIFLFYFALIMQAPKYFQLYAPVLKRKLPLQITSSFLPHKNPFWYSLFDVEQTCANL